MKKFTVKEVNWLGKKTYGVVSESGKIMAERRTWDDAITLCDIYNTGDKAAVKKAVLGR
jgi:hypothetical protein